jgi:hypothetical protein
VHVLGALEDLRGGGSERLLEQAAVGDALRECVGDRARLLVDLLEHEVPVLALLGGIGGELALADRTVDGSAVLVEHLDGGAADVGDVAFLQEHEAARHGQQRGDVRGDEVLVDPEADDHRTTLAREDDALGLLLTDDRERVRALELRDGGAHGLEQILLRLQMVVYTMGDHFGVGLRSEFVTGLLQILAQLFVVLDDAVVNDGEAVVRDVRVGIALRGHAVRRPARVRDAHLAVGRVRVDRVLEHLHLADGAQPLEVRRAIEHRDAGGVVAAILEPAQAFHQDRDDVALSDGSDDAAHLKGCPGLRGALVCLWSQQVRSGKAASEATSGTSLTSARRMGPKVPGINTLGAAQKAYSAQAAARQPVAIRVPARGTPNQ